MSETFKQFNYQKGVVTNVVFKRDYSDSVTKFLTSLNEKNITYIEFSNDLYEKTKNSIYSDENKSLLTHDLAFVDANKFGPIKTKIVLALLEQLFFQKAIIVFSPFLLDSLRLNLMKIEVFDTSLDREKKKTQPLKALVDAFSKSEEVESKKKKVAKNKQKPLKNINKHRDEHQEEAPKPLVRYTLNLFFLALFVVLSSLSSFFAFSNTRTCLYNNIVSASINEVNTNSDVDYIQTKLLSTTTYVDITELYEIETKREGEFISFVSFINSYKEQTSGTEINPLLLPFDTTISRNFRRLGLQLLVEEELETIPEVGTKAIVPSQLVRVIFDLDETSDLNDYLGATFSTNYSFKQIDFVIANIITNDVPYNLDSYYPNNMFLFTKPADIDIYSTRLVSFIKNETGAIKDYLQPLYDNYNINDYHEFSYIDQNGNRVVDGFTLNRVLSELTPSEENYLIEISFVMIALLLAYFSIAITRQLQKLYATKYKQLSVITAIPLAVVILIFIGLTIYKAASDYSVNSLALSNTFGALFSIGLTLVLALILWYPILRDLIESRNYH